MSLARGTRFKGPIGQGTGSYHSLIAAYAVKLKDNGRTFGLNLAGGFTVTLPAIALAKAGFRVTFRVETAPTTAYIITENGTFDTNKVVGEIHEVAGGAGAYDAGCTFVNFVANVAVVGDFVIVECNGSKWFARGSMNADGGITLT